MSEGSGIRSTAAPSTMGAVALLVCAAVASPAPALAATRGASAQPRKPVTTPGTTQPMGTTAANRQRHTAANRRVDLSHKRRKLPQPPQQFGPWRTALCSWYDEPQPLAGGGYLKPGMMIVAHKTLPFGTRIQFSYHGRTCIAVVKDRGPYVGQREFDLGPGTAAALGFDGVDRVAYRIAR